MSVSAANPIADLYRRLGAVGLTRKIIRQAILPEWWDDQVAANPAGFAEGISFLSRHLGLDLASLRDPAKSVTFRDLGVCKFKKSKNATEEQLALARSMATQVARLVNVATMEPCLSLPATALQMRREIIGQGHRWVGLANLIDYCWSSGIPVVHLSPLLKAKRPDGLAVKVRGRPVIVLCKQDRFTAWLLFILAHELGHIALGHIPEDGALIDESVKNNVRDVEEEAANEFAIELLTGDEDRQYFASGRWPNAAQLAEAAQEIGRRHEVDPGHVVLNHAYSMGPGFWPVANAALAILEPKRDALGVVRRKMAEHLDWSRLPEDSSEFLMRVSQDDKTSDLSLGQRHRRETGDL